MFHDVIQFTDYTKEELRQAEILLQSLLQKSGIAPTLEMLNIYNDLCTCIDNVAAVSSLLSNVHPSEEIRTAAEEAEQQVSKLATELALNKDLYTIFASIDLAPLDEVTKRLVEKTRKDFHRSGVDKSAEEREKIKELNQELVQIGQEFGRNIRDDVRFIELNSVEEMAGLPADYIKAHPPGENGKIRITTDYPDYEPFVLYAKNHDKRRELQFQFKNRAYPKNISVLKRLLEKRYELAQILGYSNWADYATEDKMILSGGAVEVFIDDVTRIATPRAETEYQLLLAEKRKEFPEAKRVEDHEGSFYKEKLKREKYDFDSQEVREYFEFNGVKEGLLDLTSELFLLRYEKAADVPTWHPTVEVYDVYSETDKLGRIYLDMHSRDNKYHHAAQFTLKSGVKGKQTPEGVLVCNFPNPAESSAGALMNHGQVVTFFHEFGHLLHHILAGKQTWVNFSGTATEWDFVEAPSQMFEEWAWDIPTLQRFARHSRTGKIIPAELVQKMKAAHEFGKGIFVRQQIFYTAISLQYYRRDPATFDTTELIRELQAIYGMYPYMDETHIEANFGHLDGYSALYYTYMWSLVIAKDILSRFKTEGMTSPVVAMDYRRQILEPGGSKPAAELVKDFLGRPYSFDAFREWLEGTD